MDFVPRHPREDHVKHLSISLQFNRQLQFYHILQLAVEPDVACSRKPDTRTLHRHEHGTIHLTCTVLRAAIGPGDSFRLLTSELDKAYFA